MKRRVASNIITANDLLSGEAVYLTSLDEWSPLHREAVMFEDATLAKKQLELVQRLDATVVGPYLARAELGEYGAAVPVHFRETFRTKGPTNRFLGKQTSACQTTHIPKSRPSPRPHQRPHHV